MIKKWYGDEVVLIFQQCRRSFLYASFHILRSLFRSLSHHEIQSKNQACVYIFSFSLSLFLSHATNRLPNLPPVFNYKHKKEAICFKFHFSLLFIPYYNRFCFLLSECLLLPSNLPRRVNHSSQSTRLREYVIIIDISLLLNVARSPHCSTHEGLAQSIQHTHSIVLRPSIGLSLESLFMFIREFLSISYIQDLIS